MNNEELLNKWLANELTDAEQEAFEKLEDYDLNKKIIEGAMHFKAPRFSPDNSYEELKSKLNTKSTPVIRLKPLGILLRIAAVFLILFSLFTLSRYNSNHTIETLASQKITFELPDASSVTLNSVSEISYSKFRWKNKRTVQLDGEAFFVVAKGSRFDVVTSEGSVSVLGTQFNVKNRDNYFEVKCFEGQVSISRNGNIQLLTKGNTYRVVNNIVMLDVTNSNRPAWLSNISSFKSVALYDVLNEIERQYNVDIITQNVDTKRLFTGGFAHDNLEQALIAVTVPFNLIFQINNSNRITISQSE
ncbi:MAG: FecR family protein [Ignavibacteriae bacterium]|nr:MAG: FecR family protein [Ignavibacteriota bacterium]